MEGEVQVPGAAEETASKLGFGGKLINIFASPTRTFDELDKRPTWIVPLLILVLVVVISTQITFPIIMDAQMENFRNNPDIPPEQLQAIETQLSQNMGTQRMISTGAQIIGTPIVFLALAGIFYILGTVLMGGDSTYKKVLSVLSWSSFISIVSVIVSIFLIMAKGNMNVSLSLALLLPADALGTKLYSLLSKFDFFTIWYLSVFAIGFGYIYRFSKAKAFAGVGILWAIWIGVSVAFSSVFSRFGM